MSTAFVIGNGLSRKNIQLSCLQSQGKIYGCNALYRNFTPDVLVSTDRGISEEIQKSGYAKRNIHYTRSPYGNSGSKILPTETRGMSSGPNALHLAIQDRHSVIYLIGFDFGSTHSQFNNVYAGTAHYKKEEDDSTYAGNWKFHISRMIELGKYIQFIRVVNEHSKIQMFNYPNYQEITVDEFDCKHK